MVIWLLSSVNFLTISECKITILFFVLQKCGASIDTMFISGELLSFKDETFDVLFANVRELLKDMLIFLKGKNDFSNC